MQHLLYFLADCNLHLPPGNWGSWGAGELEWPEGPPSHQLSGKGFSKRHPLFLDCLTHRLAKYHGPQRHPFLWGLTMARWPDFLPLVQQRGWEWGYSGESSVNYTLPPWPHLCPLPGLLHHQYRDYGVATPMSANPWPLAMKMMTGMERTMRMMTMKMKMMSLCLKRTNPPNELYILCSPGELTTPHQCCHQSRLFLSSPPSDLNCSCSLAVSIL